MITFLLVVHIIIAVGLVFFILMQHSEGGASGFVSGQMGGVMSIRGTANFLTKTTSILATLFFLSSIGLAIYSKNASKPKSIAETFKTQVKEEKKEEKPQVPVAPIAGQASNQAPNQASSQQTTPEPVKTESQTAPIPAVPAQTAPTPVAPTQPSAAAPVVAPNAVEANKTEEQKK
jgi:preprotein translocase subunit SecG